MLPRIMSTPRLPTLDECRVMGVSCACSNLRRSARLVTQHYNAKFEASGMNAMQFTILGTLHALGGLGLGALAEEVTLDPSTMTRNLAVLEKRGWVQIKPGADRRERRAVLTAKGKRSLAKAYPAWLDAQRELSEPFGAGRYQALLGSLRELTAPVRAVARGRDD
jgi:DNA-binding MarR family transcriptional regulator